MAAWFNGLLYRLRFQTRAKSLSDFAEMVISSDQNFVSITPVIKHGSGMTTRFTWPGTIGTFKYILAMQSGDLIYNEECFEREGSSHGIGDSRERVRSNVKLMLFGEKRLQELEQRLPEVAIVLMSLDGTIMEDEDFEKLHQKASKYFASMENL